MKTVIANELIRFVCDDYNAEPWSLQFHNNPVNYIWRPETPALIGPSVCFPLLGMLPDNQYTLDGQTYTMMMHGFAQNHTFKVVQKNKSDITYEMHESERTLQQYPYKFRFQIRYALRDTTLQTQYIVKNNSNKSMYYSVGGHVRYACPMDPKRLQFDDYYIEFEKPESIESIIKHYAPIKVIQDHFSQDGRKLRLDYAIFEGGCFCFHALQSKFIFLKSDSGSHSIRMNISQVPYFQLWTAAGNPYLCLEAWFGSITSMTPSALNADWKQRPGTLQLAAGEEKICSYNVTIV